MNEVKVMIKSIRDTQIPCTVVVPKVEGKMPLVLMAHGFCSNREENGMFTNLAIDLAKQGIASVRCDFAGCGESQESHSVCSLGSNMNDLDACLAYMKENYAIDEQSLALLGYSMGGKVVTHYSEKHPEIKVLGLWAPAIMNKLESIAGDCAPIYVQEEALKEAKENGAYMYANTFDDRIIPIGMNFIEQILEAYTADVFSQFKGTSLIVAGDLDDIIPIEELNKFKENYHEENKFNYHVVQGANHGFGAWTSQPEQGKELISTTLEFFVGALK